MSQSSVSAALGRAAEVQLYSPSRRRINPRALEEALVFGAKYFLGVERGGLARGIPTAWAGPPLLGKIVAHDEVPPIWPDPEGEVRGVIFVPLYPTVPAAVRQDPALYELLALVDTFREGRARDREVAYPLLKERIYLA